MSDNTEIQILKIAKNRIHKALINENIGFSSIYSKTDSNYHTLIINQKKPKTGLEHFANINELKKIDRIIKLAYEMVILETFKL